jgi:ArsR family transcriptional regulator
METASLTQEITGLHAEMCSALADPKRILILYAVADGSRNVSELGDLIGASQPAVSRHLKILRDRSLVQPVRQGASVVYHLKDMRLIEALDLLRAVLRDGIHYRANLLDTFPLENTEA